MINRTGEGKSLGDTVVFKGPRELRSVGQRIIWLSERLAWLESQRHQFLRHISHELKTPLASMREGTELLADEVAGPLSPEQKRSWRFWMPVAAIYKNLLNNCWTITASWRMVLWCLKALRLNRWWTW